jgi:hypothetical protein
VYAPGYSSAVESIQIAPNEDERAELVLARDPELAAIAELGLMLKQNRDTSALAALLSKKSGASRTLIAVARLAEEPTATGTATVAVELRLERSGVALSKKLDRASLEDALDRALACASDPIFAAGVAPALIGRIEPHLTPLRPVPPPEAVFEKPWFWGAVFFATIVASSAFVFARQVGGPPEAVEVTLIPRP